MGCYIWYQSEPNKMFSTGLEKLEFHDLRILIDLNVRMARNAPEQILIDHWTNRINTREPDPEEGLHDYLIKIGDIIEDIPPSYQQYMNLVPF